MEKRKYISYFLLALFVVGGFAMVFSRLNSDSKSASSTSSSAKSKRLPITFRMDGKLEFVDAQTNAVLSKIEIEMADEFSERQQGLKYRKSMKESQGMFFLFNKEEEQSFWMQDTPLSLDIVYVNAKLQIVSIARKTSPFSEDPIPSNGAAQYVVEVLAGYCQRHDINPGDLIRTVGRDG